MHSNIHDRHLIDRYLQGELSGIELDSFNQRLKSDEQFRMEVELQKIVYEGVKAAHLKKLEANIIAALDYHKPAVPFALKMIFTFLTITGLGITLWFYIGKEAAYQEREKSWLAFLKNKGGAHTVNQDTARKNPVPKSKITSFADSSTKEEAAMALRADTITAEPRGPVTDSISATDNDANIVVKQDQLLISTVLQAEDKSDVKSEADQTLSEEAAGKLNPAADLPVTEKPSNGYLVEFWVSPINYRGYKMSKNKLVLFGIDEPDAVKLYRVNGVLYMSYLNEFFRLNDTFEFLSYQKLKDTEVPLAIK